MSRDLQLILNLLVLGRQDISNLIKNGAVDYLYFGDDSEDEGTEFPELLLIRLCYEIFVRETDVNVDMKQQLQEMCCVVYFAIDFSETNQASFLLKSENSYDLFWEILKRYAELILSANKEFQMQRLESFPFIKMLEQFNFSAEELTKEQKEERIRSFIFD